MNEFDAERKFGAKHRRGKRGRANVTSLAKGGGARKTSEKGREGGKNGIFCYTPSHLSHFPCSVMRKERRRCFAREKGAVASNLRRTAS